MNIRELRADEVQFRVSILEEEDEVEGHFASGDEKVDAANVKEVKDRLRQGDTWAWCMITVTAKWKEWTGKAYLGSCSYEDEASFKKDAYYQQMLDEALGDLNDSIRAAASNITELTC